MKTCHLLGIQSDPILITLLLTPNISSQLWIPNFSFRQRMFHITHAAPTAFDMLDLKIVDLL